MGLAAVSTVYLHLNYNVEPFKPSYSTIPKFSPPLSQLLKSGHFLARPHAILKKNGLCWGQGGNCFWSFPTFCQQLIDFTSQYHKKFGSPAQKVLHSATQLIPPLAIFWQAVISNPFLAAVATSLIILHVIDVFSSPTRCHFLHLGGQFYWASRVDVTKI